MANQISLTVGGIKYSIKSDESTEYLNELALNLEERLLTITKQNPTISTTMVVILAALETEDELKKAEMEIERLNDLLKNGSSIQQKIRFTDK